MTRPGIEPVSTASVADALSTRPLIGIQKYHKISEAKGQECEEHKNKIRRRTQKYPRPRTGMLRRVAKNLKWGGCFGGWK